MPIDRSKIRKGMFLTSTPVPAGYVRKRAPLPDDLREFEQAAARADEMAAFERQHAANIAELARRLQKVREGIDAVKNRRK